MLFFYMYFVSFYLIMNCGLYEISASKTEALNVH